MFDFAGSDPESQCSKRTVRGSMRIAAHDRHARLSQSKFRADYVDDALLGTIKVVKLYAEVFAIASQGFNLLFGNQVNDWKMPVDRRDVMVFGRNRQIRTADLTAGDSQTFKRLRAGDFVDQMQIDVQHRLLARFVVDNVLVPDLFEERLWCGGNHDDSDRVSLAKYSIRTSASDMRIDSAIIKPNAIFWKFPFRLCSKQSTLSQNFLLSNLDSDRIAIPCEMTEIIEAAILGVVQGLTEFLPVSSSGHIEIARALFGGTAIGKASVLMTVVLHFATAISTVVVFRKEVAEILKGLFQFKYNEHSEFTLKIILSMIPAALVGILFDKQIESLFTSNMLLVGCMLLVTGVLLLLADRAKQTDKSVGFFSALIVGISQAIAILPGISRSGATISTCVLLGIDRSKAARFSFLMVVPLIFGKMAKDMLDGDLWTAGTDPVPLIVGFVVAFFTGLLACTWMISLVKAANLKWFSWYCFAVGAIAIAAGVYALAK